MRGLRESEWDLGHPTGLTMETPIHISCDLNPLSSLVSVVCMTKFRGSTFLQKKS